MALKSTVQLRPHQENAVTRTENREGNIIFSHPVGSGKTLTSIAAFEHLKDIGKATRALVVTPASLRTNYGENGVKKFTNSDYRVYGNKQEISSDKSGKFSEPTSAGPEYGVVSYELFREDPEKYIKGHGADTVIFDEIHRIKNDESKTFKSLKDNRGLFKNFIGMTGSVSSNTPSDVIPLIDAMTGGHHSLGSKASFENRFVTVDKHGNKSIQNKALVRGLLAPYVHHVTEEQITSGTLRPPVKEVHEIEVPLEGQHEEYYRYIIDQLDPITKAKLQLGVGKLSKAEMDAVFAKLLKSRQVANSMHTVDSNMSLEESAEKSVKVKRLLDDVENHINSTPDAQVVIHSELLKGGLDVIEAGLKHRGIEFGKFIGKGNAGVTEKARQQDVSDYNAGKKKVILISSAGGEGIDLPNTTMVASLDGHWNPERINQVEARGIRMGGLSHRPEEDRKVIVNRYLTKLNPSKVDVAMKTYKLFNPRDALFRMLEGQPIVYNPLKSTDTVDQLMYRVAKQKAQGNEELKSMFDKTASFSVNSDKQILENYINRFGDKLAGGTYANGGYINEAEENKYVNQLRKYYTNAKKKDVGRITPAKFNEMSGKSNLRNMAEIFAKNTALGTALAGGLLAKPILDGIVLSKGRRLSMAARGLGLASLGGAALGTLALHQANKPHYTTSSAEANKRLKLTDKELLQMLRGESVNKEEIKRTQHFVRMK